MSRAADLVAGLRAILLTAGVTPVQIGPLTDTPDAAVGITPYPVTSDAWTGSDLDAVQILIRGSKTAGIKPVLDTQDTVFDTLAALRGTTVGGVPVAVCWRQISAPLSPDASGRPEIRDTYYLRTDRLGVAG